MFGCFGWFEVLGFWVQVWGLVLGFREEGEMVLDAIGFLGVTLGFLMKMIF